MSDFKIDATDPNNLSNKVLDERESRKRFLTYARMIGVEFELLQLFAKADKLRRNCKNEQEFKDMGKFFAQSAWKIIGGGGKLFIDGELVCDEEWKEAK